MTSIVPAEAVSLATAKLEGETGERKRKKKDEKKNGICPGWLLFSYEITIPLSPREIIDRHGNNTGVAGLNISD